MRKQSVRWLQVNVFLNPFILDLKPVGKPGSWCVDFYWIEIRKSTGSSVTDIFIQKSCAFLTSLWRRESQSEAQTFEEGEWLRRGEKSLSVSFQRQAKGGSLSFYLSLVGLVIVFCLFVVVLPKSCPPFYL